MLHFTYCLENLEYEIRAKYTIDLGRKWPVKQTKTSKKSTRLQYLIKIEHKDSAHINNLQLESSASSACCVCYGHKVSKPQLILILDACQLSYMSEELNVGVSSK